MLYAPIREVEHKRRGDYRVILVGLIIFIMALTLLGGKVRLYELRQTCQELENTLEEQTQTLEELRQKTGGTLNLEQRAKALGLEKINSENVEILHIRGQMTD